MGLLRTAVKYGAQVAVAAATQIVAKKVVGAATEIVANKVADAAVKKMQTLSEDGESKQKLARWFNKGAAKTADVASQARKGFGQALGHVGTLVNTVEGKFGRRAQKAPAAPATQAPAAKAAAASQETAQPKATKPKAAKKPAPAKKRKSAGLSK